jgi:hypothetical protein
VACLAAALCAAPATSPCSAGEPAAGEREIDQLIAQLGSDSFEAREAATRKLMEREDAIPALRKALKSSDAEVAHRAGQILDALARKENERAFARFADLAKNGAADQAVERFVRRARWNDEKACWKALADLANRLTELERKTYGKASLPDYKALTREDFSQFLRECNLTAVAPRGAAPEQGERHLVLRAEEIAPGADIMFTLLALSGGAKVRGVNRSIIFAGGSVEAGHTASGSLILCDGDVTADYFINSLVIARGTIHCRSSALNSRLISCGEVRYKDAKDLRDTKVVEKEAKPLGLVTFFDPAQVGITVEAAEGGVKVKSAEKGKPFAAAGLRAGDLVVALDGTAAKDAESFRRLLRAKVAAGGEMAFKVRRGEEAVEIRVPWKE